MKTTQIRWQPASGWQPPDADIARRAQLVLAFGDHDYFQDPACFTDLKGMFPTAHILGCSSSGNVLDTAITDGDIVATGVFLEHGRVKFVATDVAAGDAMQALGTRLVNELDDRDLRHVFILSDGLSINGSDLAKGLDGGGARHNTVTGGLAGDGPRFGKTWVMTDAPAVPCRIGAVGLYGDLSVKCGCYAGWEEFGADRVVSRSVGNVVYEIDGQPALALYKRYLGAQAAELPASGLRFPLSVRPSKDSTPIIRTLLAVNEDAQSLTFAGDVPEGHFCKLMRANLDNLIDSAAMAAAVANPGGPRAAGLCLVVSCVGRRLVLGQMTEEELEAVREKLGGATAITGFYSYGELAPFGAALQCHLHNQTMTLTAVYE